jgi:TP901 family phage tail tape measure protein
MAGSFGGTIRLEGEGEYKKALESINSSLKVLTANAQAASAGFKASGDAIAAATEKHKALSKIYDEQAKKVETLEKALEKAKQEHGDGSKEVQKYSEQLAKAEAALEKTNQELLENSKHLADNRTSWEKAASNLADFGAKAAAAADALRPVSDAAGKLFTGSIESAIKFESSFAGVRKTVDTTEEGFKKLQQAALEMSKTKPVDVNDINLIMELGGQLGIAAGDLDKFAAVIADLDVSTDLGLEEGSKSIAQFANITKMSMGDVDRFGATIVGLGNNYATTESDIMALAMRLAASGTQVGISQQGILALSAAMSSVGLSAEAGGSAMSSVMTKIDTAVATNGEKLNGWAKLAKMSTSDFRKAWETDALGAMLKVTQGMGDVEKEGGNLSVTLTALDVTELRQTDAMKRLSGASDVLAGAIGTANSAWDENSALTAEAGRRYETVESQFQMLKNEVTALGVEFGSTMIPVARKVIEVAKDLVSGFSGLPEPVKAGVMALLGVTAAVAPVLSGVGKVSTGLSSIISLFAKFGGAATAAGGAAAAAGTGATGLGAALAAINPVAVAVVAGVAALGIAAVAVGKEMQKASVESDRFGSGVSDATKEALTGFYELEQKSKIALDGMYISGTAVTKEMKSAIASDLMEMANAAMQGFDEQRKAAIEGIAALQGVNEDEKKQMLETVNAAYDEKTQAVADSYSRVEEIMHTAAEEHRALTEAEWEEANAIIGQLSGAGTEALAASVDDQKQLLERAKSEKTKLAAEEAGEIIKQANEKRDAVVGAAQEEYDKVVAAAEAIRNSGVPKAEETAQKMIEAAEKQRDGVVGAAEETRDKTVAAALEMAGEYAGNIDKMTGDVLTKGEKFARDWKLSNAAMLAAQRGDWEEHARIMAELHGNIVDSGSKMSEDEQKAFSEMSAAVTKDIEEMARVGGEDTKEFANSVKDYLKGVEDGKISVEDMTKFVESDMAEMNKNGSKEARDFAQEVLKTLGSAKTESSSAANTLGAGIVAGIAAGVDVGSGGLFSKLKSLASKALSAAKEALASASPSKKFRDQVGITIPEGIGVGIEAATPDMLKAMGKAMDRLSPVAEAGMASLQKSFEAPLAADLEVKAPKNYETKAAQADALTPQGGVTVTVEHMEVRSDNDIRLVSQQLYALQQQGARAQGRGSL